ncbi:hypothetical protein NEOKW01_1695 [Nematocida sp. AWRm80]|nr:hypothetical protein NEOKW01_1695 [Nematocida sp. AWRm80]
MQNAYDNEDRESSEEFEIILNDEEEDQPERTELLDTYTLECDAYTDKPWNKPGEDITDYFNYGFNETTWKEYLSKQRKLRDEFPSRQKKKEKDPWTKDNRKRRPNYS